MPSLYSKSATWYVMGRQQSHRCGSCSSSLATSPQVEYESHWHTGDCWSLQNGSIWWTPSKWWLPKSFGMLLQTPGMQFSAGFWVSEEWYTPMLFIYTCIFLLLVDAPSAVGAKRGGFNPQPKISYQKQYPLDRNDWTGQNQKKFPCHISSQFLSKILRNWRNCGTKKDIIACCNLNLKKKKGKPSPGQQQHFRKRDVSETNASPALATALPQRCRPKISAKLDLRLPINTLIGSQGSFTWGWIF